MTTLFNHILTEMTVALQSQENYDQQVLCGKVFVNEKEHQVSFTQNKPRGPRSREVMRTPHSRLVRRPDGRFTLSFRFSKEELEIGPQLLREMKAVVETLALNLKKRAA